MRHARFGSGTRLTHDRKSNATRCGRIRPRKAFGKSGSHGAPGASPADGLRDDALRNSSHLGVLLPAKQANAGLGVVLGDPAPAHQDADGPIDHRAVERSDRSSDGSTLLMVRIGQARCAEAQLVPAW